MTVGPGEGDVTDGVSGDPEMPAGDMAMDWQEMDRLMTESVEGYPVETEGVGAQLLEPTILPDGTKEFHLTAEIVDWEVEPGKSSRRGPTTAPSPPPP